MLTTTIIHLMLSPLCLLFLVRLEGYIVNLCVFYSCRMQLQEFSLRNRPVDCSTSSVWRSLYRQCSTSSACQQVKITHLMGWSKDDMSLCLVYSFKEGGSLQDRQERKLASRRSLPWSYWRLWHPEISQR